MSWLRTTVLLLAVSIGALAACDAADDPLPDGVTTTREPPPPAPSVEEVAEVESCRDLVDVGELFVRNMVQLLETGLPIEVLTGERPAPPEVEALRAVGEELDARASRLDCSAAGLNADIVAEIDDIESDEPVVALFLEIVREGVVRVGE